MLFWEPLVTSAESLGADLDTFDNLGRVAVRREPGSSSILRAFRVLVDGKEVGRLRRDGELGVDVEPGTHAVQIRIDWAGSKPLEVTVGPGEVVRLVCEPAPFIQGLISIFRAPSEYIQLRASE